MVKVINNKTYFLKEDQWYSADKNNVEKKVGNEKLLAKLNEKESKGLGDSIKKLTNFLGITQCDGCKDRQAYLNKKFKYNRPNVDAITEERLELFKRVKSVNVVQNDDVNEMFLFYNELFNAQVQRCNCPNLLLSINEQIETVLANMANKL